MPTTDMLSSSTTTLNGDSDETIDSNAESLWMEEIRRRDAQIRAGTANLKPLKQVLREARELLRSLK